MPVTLTLLCAGEDVCCSVVFSTLVGVFSVMWSELLMTSALSCPVWSSVYDCHNLECAFTSPVRFRLRSSGDRSVGCVCKQTYVAWFACNRCSPAIDGSVLIVVVRE